MSDLPNTPVVLKRRTLTDEELLVVAADAAANNRSPVHVVRKAGARLEVVLVDGILAAGEKRIESWTNGKMSTS